MKDIPLFTTQYGIASLALQQIPHRSEAYVTIRQAEQPEELLRECVRFCRMCGAERVFAAGHDCLQRLPLHTHVYRMTGYPGAEEAACLWPVTKENAAAWRKIYNEKMMAVDNATILSFADERQLYEQGGAYFVHDGQILLGIGWLQDKELLALASVVPGMGAKVLSSILSIAGEGPVHLEVASTNAKAIRLYEKMGFMKTEILRSWYCVE